MGISFHAVISGNFHADRPRKPHITINNNIEQKRRERATTPAITFLCITTTNEEVVKEESHLSWRIHERGHFNY